jgi:SOS-response transcriptional repressor LexA
MQICYTREKSTMLSGSEWSAPRQADQPPVPLNELLTFLSEHIEQHGYWPSLQDIKNRCGMRSTSVARRVLAELLTTGHIQPAPPGSRITVVLNLRRPAASSNGRQGGEGVGE